MVSVILLWARFALNIDRRPPVTDIYRLPESIDDNLSGESQLAYLWGELRVRKPYVQVFNVQIVKHLFWFETARRL